MKKLLIVLPFSLCLSGCKEEKTPAPLPLASVKIPEDFHKVTLPPVEPPPAPPPEPEPEPEPEPLDEVKVDWRPQQRALQAKGRRIKRQQHRLQQPVVSVEQVKQWRLKDSGYDPKKNPQDLSSYPVDRSRLITTDRRIPVVVEDSVNSQLPGPVVLVVERHVFGADHRFILLPKGTRIVGHYEPLEREGDSRLQVVCTRAIRPDGVNINLSEALTSDQMGRSGLIGSVDNRIWQRYGAAFVFSGLSALSSGASDMSNNFTMTNAATALSNNLGQVTARVLEKNIDLAPVMTIPPGSRAQIRPLRDICLKAPEEEVVDVNQVTEEQAKENQHAQTP